MRAFPAVLIALLALAFLVAMTIIFGKAFGWLGVLVVTAVFTLICFYFFYRTMRLLKAIQVMPEGYTAQAEYFHAHIRTGMNITKIVQIAQALGKKISDNPIIYVWEDKQNRVAVTFENNKATAIELTPLAQTEAQTDTE